MKSLFPLALFPALFGFVFSVDLCPPPDQIEPCDCISGYKPVTYKCSKIFDQDTIEEVISKSMDWPLNALIFDHSSLLYVSQPLINTKDITTLAIYHSKFSAPISSQPGENNKMENIILRNTTFAKGLDWRLFKNMFLKIIQVQEVLLKRIGKPFVENVKSSVEQLTLEKAGIQTLHSEAFSKLTSLTSLSCAYNAIRSVQRSMFPRETSLYFLDFRCSVILTRASGTSKHKPSLSKVLFSSTSFVISISTLLPRIEGLLKKID